MSSLAEQLMTGPRGRRVCLDAVSFTDQDVIRAEFDLRFVFDPAPTVRLHVGDGDASPLHVDAAVDVLRSALAAVEAVDEHFVHLALENAVNMARYWQEPEGTEVLASRPEIAPEIDRLAQLVAVSPAAGWWTDTIAPEQFQVRMEGWRDRGQPPARSVLLTWAENTRSEEQRAVVERPSDPRANYSAIWWSCPPYQLIQTCSEQVGVPTGLYLVEDGFGETRASVHRVMGSGRVLEIDSAAVWADLCREHPLEVTASRHHDWYRTTGLADTRWVMPDWEAVSREYDAVHLQVGAYLAASGTAIEVEPGVHSVIAGWAPGDTYWLTDVVEVEPRGRIFVKDRDDDLWHAEEE
ncbi:Uncharacterised protein [Tsukamurella paurometabola]|uniref:Uncharacterized protein n=1 Tax=Tsukamurella paurometabola TaxID=2061 RepID=A0A3P8L610_TSUPA|nr:Uncharacterised protein [Tsukamurella paurometabola]